MHNVDNIPLLIFSLISISRNRPIRRDDHIHRHVVQADSESRAGTSPEAITCSLNDSAAQETEMKYQKEWPEPFIVL
jgi:hypothetical protein